MREAVKEQITRIIAAAIFAIEWESNKRSRVNAFHGYYNKACTAEDIERFKREKKKNCNLRAEEAVKEYFKD